jgi:hypothetical protein
MAARSHLTFANGILMERYMITADRVPDVDPGQPELYDVADELVRQGVIPDVAGPSVAPSVSPELVRSDGSRSEPPDLVQTGSGNQQNLPPYMP